MGFLSQSRRRESHPIFSGCLTKVTNKEIRFTRVTRLTSVVCPITTVIFLNKKEINYKHEITHKNP
jgi:hypothetical protein